MDDEASIYTCPMHAEIRRPGPGSCPICGMALEPLMPAPDAGDNPELADFRRRFWWTLPLSAAVFALAMLGHWLWPDGLAHQNLSSVSVIANALRLRR